MRKNAFNSSEHIKPLNEFKQLTNYPLSEEDIRIALKNCGIPSNILFFNEFKNSGILLKVEGNLYVWNSSEPIHYKFLQTVYSNYQRKVNEYAYRAYQKKKEGQEYLEISDAIQLLKSKGFIILTPGSQII